MRRVGLPTNTTQNWATTNSKDSTVFIYYFHIFLSWFIFQFCNLKNQIISFCHVLERHLNSQQFTKIYFVDNFFNTCMLYIVDLRPANKSLLPARVSSSWILINEGPRVIEIANLLLYILLQSQDKVFVKQEDVKVINWNVHISVVRITLHTMANDVQIRFQCDFHNFEFFNEKKIWKLTNQFRLCYGSSE